VATASPAPPSHPVRNGHIWSQVLITVRLQPVKRPSLGQAVAARTHSKRSDAGKKNSRRVGRAPHAPCPRARAVGALGAWSRGPEAAGGPSASRQGLILHALGAPRPKNPQTHDLASTRINAPRKRCPPVADDREHGRGGSGPELGIPIGLAPGLPSSGQSGGEAIPSQRNPSIRPSIPWGPDTTSDRSLALPHTGACGRVSRRQRGSP
jgi:hypothetical protein